MPGPDGIRYAVLDQAIRIHLYTWQGSEYTETGFRGVEILASTEYST